MDNVLFYFLSTISQVLAALIPLIFVFAILQINQFEKFLKLFCTEFASILENNVTEEGIVWKSLGTGVDFMKNFLINNFSYVHTSMYDICNERENDLDKEETIFEMKYIAGKTRIFVVAKNKFINEVIKLSIVGFVILFLAILTIIFVNDINNCFSFLIGIFVAFISALFYYLLKMYKLLKLSLSNDLYFMNNWMK